MTNKIETYADRVYSNHFVLNYCVFLLRFHPKHNDKRQTKARGYSGRPLSLPTVVINESEYKAKKI